jgi:hypothetical protein
MGMEVISCLPILEVRMVMVMVMVMVMKGS